MAWWKFPIQWFYTDVREDSGLDACTEKVQTKLHLTLRDWRGFIELVPWNQERLLLYFMPLRVSLSNIVPEVATTGQQTDQGKTSEYHSFCETVLGVWSLVIYVNNMFNVFRIHPFFLFL